MFDRISRRILLALGASVTIQTAHAQSITPSSSGEDFTIGAAEGADGGAAPVTIPVGTEGYAALVAVSVNGAAPAPFIFDTGAAATMIDLDFASQNRVAAGWGADATGAKGNSQSVGVAQGVSLQLGGVLLQNQTVAIMKLPNNIVDRGKRRRIAGIIGCNAFSDRIVRLDMMRRSLSWLPDGAEPDPAGVTVPLQEKLGIFQGAAAAMSVSQLTIPVTLDGITQDFIFDTGAGTDVVLGYDNAQQLHARERYPKYIDLKTPGGIDGPIRMSMAIGKSLAVAGAAFATPSVSMKMEAPSSANRDWRRPSAPDYDGLIGLAALAEYVLFIDIKNQRLVLEPGGWRRGPPLMRTTGISADKKSRTSFQVLSVIKGTPAEQAGVSEGDEIVALNGQPAIDFSLADLGRLSANADHGPASLTFADGRVLTLQAVQVLP